jgi:transketolase
MRNAFIDALLQAAADDERVWLVTGDLGFSVLDKFAQRFPQRYVNAGVAEQNMTGVAAGLAMAGNIVFTYSIANFPTLRCLEQIRNDVCYHNLPVIVVAVGGGLSYGSSGYTHHGVEDFAIMGALPNMAVVAPGDPMETRLAVDALLKRNGPAYLRLGKAGEPVVHKSVPSFALGQALELRAGDDAAILSTGAMLETAVRAADDLRKRDVRARVLSFPTLEPFDAVVVARAARETKVVVTVEEHGPGGLASRAAEAVATAGIAVRFVPLRLNGEPSRVAGSQAWLRQHQGLTAEAIVAAVLG